MYIINVYITTGVILRLGLRFRSVSSIIYTQTKSIDAERNARFEFQIYARIFKGGFHGSTLE